MATSSVGVIRDVFQEKTITPPRLPSATNFPPQLCEHLVETFQKYFFH